MLKARVDLNRLLPEQAPEPDQVPNLLQTLQSNGLYQHLLRRLQRRYLELALQRNQSSDRVQYEYDTGVQAGAYKMLEVIDTVMAEATRKRQPEPDESDIEQ